MCLREDYIRWCGLGVGEYYGRGGVGWEGAVDFCCLLWGGSASTGGAKSGSEAHFSDSMWLIELW